LHALLERLRYGARLQNVQFVDSLWEGLTDPVWFFVTDWLAILLVSRGYSPQDSLLAFWIPFLAADIGNG
jgi:hypothetical protein